MKGGMWARGRMRYSTFTRRPSVFLSLSAFSTVIQDAVLVGGARLALRFYPPTLGTPACTKTCCNGAWRRR